MVILIILKVYLIHYEEEFLILKDEDDNGIIFLNFPNFKSVNIVGYFPKFSERKAKLFKKLFKIKKFLLTELN